LEYVKHPNRPTAGVVVKVVVPVEVTVLVGVVVSVVRSHSSNVNVCRAKTAAFTIAASYSHVLISEMNSPAKLQKNSPLRSPIVNLEITPFNDATVVSQLAVLSRRAITVLPSASICTLSPMTSV
jgi:hypothetical protein